MNEGLLYGTTNSGKIFEVGKLLDNQGIPILTPSDLKISLEVPETGESLEENASIKAKAYRQLVGDDILVMVDDTGIEIDALGGEPGIHVRRWKDGVTRMSDRQIIDHCLKRLKGVALPKRGAQFRTVIAISDPGGQIEYFEGILSGRVRLEPDLNFLMEGFPFESLFEVPEWDGKLLGEIHRLPSGEKTNFISHRESAVLKALPRIKEIMNS